MTKLDEIIEKLQGKQVYIQTHNFPDPDAIASAYGLRELLKFRGIFSEICYKGKIDRSSTIRMIKQLKIDIINVDDITRISDKSEIILIDTQKGNANTSDIIGNEHICIDHHQVNENSTYEYSDIRPQVGACSSIIAEYYFENGISFNKNIATALMYGLKIDTANMSRGVSDLDLEMFYRLYKLSDRTLLNELDMNMIQFTDLYAYAHAINSIKIYDNMSFSNTGIDCPEALIATISDFVLALEEVNLSIVYSLKKDGIKLSVRSDKKEYDAGLITRLALQGIGNGGGHDRMAGGFVLFGPDVNKEMLCAEIEERFIQTVQEKAYLTAN